MCRQESGTLLEQVLNASTLQGEYQTTEPLVTFEEFVIGESELVLERMREGPSRKGRSSARSTRRHRRALHRASSFQFMPDYPGPGAWYGLPDATQKFRGRIRRTTARQAKRPKRATRMLWRYVARRALQQMQQVQITEQAGRPAYPTPASRLSSTGSIYSRAVKSSKSTPFRARSQTTLLFQNIVKNMLVAKREQTAEESPPACKASNVLARSPVSVHVWGSANEDAERPRQPPLSPGHLGPGKWLSHSSSQCSFRQASTAKEEVQATRPKCSPRMLWQYMAKQALEQAKQDRQVSSDPGPRLGRMSPTDSIRTRALQSSQTLPFQKSRSAMLFQNIVQNLLAKEGQNAERLPQSTGRQSQ